VIRDSADARREQKRRPAGAAAFGVLRWWVVEDLNL